MSSQVVKVSICVAYFNRSEYLKTCIDSLLNQSFDSYEVIVVNDGSEDPNTKKYLDDYNDPRLTVIHQENTGFVGAIRSAISKAKGEYIAIHGAGDVSLPERIKTQANFLDNNHEIGAVGCRYENIVRGGNNDGHRKVYEYGKSKLNIDNFLVGSNPFGHGEVMFRRSLYDLVGGYREFFRFSQDLDLWLRMIVHQGMQILPEVLYQRFLFVADGISTNRRKLVLQKYLAVFAKQCHADKLNMGKDYVDLYGQNAGLFRRKSSVIAVFCSKKAMQALHQNKLVDANEFIELSLNETKSFFNVIFFLVIKASKFTLIKNIAIKIISLHPRSANWYQN